MTNRTLTLTLFALALPGITAFSQQEGSTPTQALIAFDSKAAVSPTAKDITAKVDNRNTSLLNLAPIPPNGAQVALLIDDGLRTSIGGELNNLRSFITSLPQGTEVFVGFMQNGRVVSANDMPGFTADRAAAAQSLRLPLGLPGASASPYFCLSDFVKNWPSNAANHSDPRSHQPTHKATIVLMITNSVDPYTSGT